ncbi:helix-turn-helix domain-containing protein [Janthinobacterium sp. 78]|uniref:helix-turn-helix domain-containing protein n=1 Tax=Janthinobacterium sp. 78 TaxID=2135631 RepID=UPI000E321204|nr:helix-turn-helix domain-containing protein [Janthinobacterium sp. 78]
MSISSPSITVLADGRMSRKDAALYLGLAAKTLAMYATKGSGPSFVKGGRIWYRQDDLDAWLSDLKAKSTAQARLKP